MGRFTETPYFLIDWFFKKIKDTDGLDKPAYDYEWSEMFMSVFGGDPRTGSTDTNPSSGVYMWDDNVFVDYKTNTWNRRVEYDGNLLQTFNSYILMPLSTIVSRGGGLVDLYVKENDFGYQPITVRYTGHEGNEFNFNCNTTGQFEPGDGTIEETLSGSRYLFQIFDTVVKDSFDLFSNNRETYWRKDSLYHDWLKIYAEEILLEEMGVEFDIRKYNNTDTIFMYFQNIFKDNGDERNVRIIFDGMKDFVMRAVPEHQRTERFTELCEIFFDRLYHEMFNLLKDVWSLIDPMQVDDRYLGYLSKYYDMFDVSLDTAPLLQIREFIRDMIWMVKRKGTYTEFYILWRILTATKNILNVYERWHPKDIENFSNWPSTVTPASTGSWPNFPYYSNTNPELSNPSRYIGEWPYTIDTLPSSASTTVVPTSAWVDVLYIYRDEYEAPVVSGGAGYGWYQKWYPNTYVDSIPASASDNLLMSTHYIIETDISYEPLESNKILSKDSWDRMHGYWEYVRPVNRVSNYRIVEAPITDISGVYMNLYEPTSKSTAYLQTKSYVSYDIAENVHIENRIGNPSTVWNFTHNLGSNILVQVFDGDLNEVIPKDISQTPSTLTITFHQSIDGVALVKQAPFESTKLDDDLSWDVYHGRSEKEVILNYRLDGEDAGERIIAKDVELNQISIGSTTLNIASTDFSDTEKYTSTAEVGNFIYAPPSPSDEWVIPHDLNMRGVMLAVYDENNMKIHPSNYELSDQDNCTLKFNGVQDGYAVIISIGDLSIEAIIEELESLISNVSYIVYTKYDENGVYDENNRYVCEYGDYVKVYHDEDGKFYYFDAILETSNTYIINEIELIDNNGDVMMHSRMSDLYKPEDVDMTFHFRLSTEYLTEEV